jgi:cation:H+ antiporter
MPLEGLSATASLALFALAAVATWVAGVKLAGATDILDDHFGLGQAIGGMILLSVVGSLPELAITVSAALGGHLDIAAGNLIGGVAMQTLVLVIADACIRGDRPLSTAVASLVPALEALLVVAVVAVTAMSALLPDTAAIGPLGLGSVFILSIWIVGILTLNRVRDRTDLALPVAEVTDTSNDVAADPVPEPAGRPEPAVRGTIIIFTMCSLVTLVAGVLLERTGNRLADDWGINGVLFGATILAAASALPEISTGITGVRLERYTLVYGDIFGGNAFQLTLFVVADLCAGQPVLPHEGAANAWIAMTGLIMTTVYAASLVLRPSRRHLRLGSDSWVVLLVYALGLWGFVVVSG